MTATDRQFIADKDREYKQYLIWRSLPRDIDRDLFEKLGVTDEIILELSELRNQGQLAKYLGVRPKTISDWNKQPIPDEFKELDWRYWAKQATPSVMSALLRNVRKHGDAARVTAWMTHVEGYEPKSRHALTGPNGESIIEGLAGLIAGADRVLEEHGESS